MEDKNIRSAEDYLKFAAELQNVHGLELMEKMKPVQGEEVLDLGCGTGYLSSVLAERVGTEGRVMAIDPDCSRIRVAKNAFGHVTNLTFIEGSICTMLDLGKACYDAVFVNFVLHWIEDKNGAFRNIYESLKPGGRVAMLYGVKPIPPLLNQAARDLNPEENYQEIVGKFTYVDKEIIEEYCQEAGFVILESKETTLVAAHEDLAHYLPFASAVTHGVFDLDVIDEQKLKIFKPPLDEDGRILDEYPMAVLLATKPGG